MTLFISPNKVARFLSVLVFIFGTFGVLAEIVQQATKNW